MKEESCGWITEWINRDGWRVQDLGSHIGSVGFHLQNKENPGESFKQRNHMIQCEIALALAWRMNWMGSEQIERVTKVAPATTQARDNRV